jgi:hypothetical protein
MVIKQEAGPFGNWSLSAERVLTTNPAAASRSHMIPREPLIVWGKWENFFGQFLASARAQAHHSPVALWLKPAAT